MQNVRDWLKERVNRFELGLELISDSKLSQKMFSASEMNIAIADIKKQMSGDWDLSETDKFGIYRQAKAGIIPVGSKYRLLNEVPVYDKMIKMTLYCRTHTHTYLHTRTHASWNERQGLTKSPTRQPPRALTMTCGK